LQAGRTGTVATLPTGHRRAGPTRAMAWRARKTTRPPAPSSAPGSERAARMRARSKDQLDPRPTDRLANRGAADRDVRDNRGHLWRRDGPHRQPAPCEISDFTGDAAADGARVWSARGILVAQLWDNASQARDAVSQKESPLRTVLLLPTPYRVGPRPESMRSCANMHRRRRRRNGRRCPARTPR
jgi:hypothetical protein